MQSQMKPEFQPSESQSPVRQPAALSLGLPRLLLGTVVALSTIVGDAVLCSAQAASLTNWSFDPTINQLEITVKDGTTPRYFLMAQPARIVVDLPDTAIGNVSAQKNYAGAVRQIRVSQFEPGLTRIVMEISPGVSLAPGQVELQKVGDRATQAGNSRWVVRPLVSKSLSANTIAVNPISVPPLKPVAPIATPTKPIVASSTARLDNRSTQRQPAAREANLPSPPPAENSNLPTKTDAATDSRNNAAPPGSTAAVPTSPVDLAPVLPTAPTQNAETKTPLPPTVVTPLDPNMGIDTSSGVAIAVPSPIAAPSPTMAPSTVTPATVTLPTAPSAAVPQAVTTVPPKPAVTPRPTARITASVQPPNRSLATTKPAPTAPIAPSVAPAVADIPLTLAARPSAVAPSVSVPPLNDPTQNDRTQTNQDVAPALPPRSIVPSRPPKAALETLPALPTTPQNQPSISVPPPIQVGTPALGSRNGVPRLEAAPYTPPLSAAPSTVSVPPLQSAPPLQQTAAPSTPLPPEAGASYDADTIRQAPTTSLPGMRPTYDANTVRQQLSAANLAPPLALAPLQAPAVTSIASPTYDATTVRQAPVSPASAPIVKFGQPLPVTPNAARVSSQPLALLNQSPGIRQALKPTAPNVLLPAGTPLNLRYPGNAALSLRTDSPQQEVMVLQADLRDGFGNVLAPAGSLVTGRFETTTAGSQFVTQAIAIAGRSLPLVAQSEALDGTRQITGTNLARNSGIGVLAGGVLGAISGSTGLGALGGAAAGAAATFITAPKPAMIQPGQLIQVRLTQDLTP